jgi:hypothetical protein
MSSVLKLLSLMRAITYTLDSLKNVIVDLRLFTLVSEITPCDASDCATKKVDFLSLMKVTLL